MNSLDMLLAEPKEFPTDPKMGHQRRKVSKIDSGFWLSSEEDGIVIN